MTSISRGKRRRRRRKRRKRRGGKGQFSRNTRCVNLSDMTKTKHDQDCSLRPKGTIPNAPRACNRLCWRKCQRFVIVSPWCTQFHLAVSVNMITGIKHRQLPPPLPPGAATDCRAARRYIPVISQSSSLFRDRAPDIPVLPLLHPPPSRSQDTSLAAVIVIVHLSRARCIGTSRFCESRIGRIPLRYVADRDRQVTVKIGGSSSRVPLKESNFCENTQQRDWIGSCRRADYFGGLFFNYETKTRQILYQRKNCRGGPRQSLGYTEDRNGSELIGERVARCAGPLPPPPTSPRGRVHRTFGANNAAQPTPRSDARTCG